MRYFALAILLMAGQAAAQPAEFDPADFGKIVVSPRQSADGLTFEQAFGDYQNEPVVDYGPNGPAVKMGRPIGRLDLLYEKGKTGFCTAFIVDQEHIITNHHCIPGMDGDPTGVVSGVSAAQFVAGYINPGRETGVDRYTVSPTIVETNRELDYTVLRVFGDPSTKYGILELSDADPEDSEFLWIIGHPEGQSQHISREGCAASSPAVSTEGKLIHTCDTLGGNSGSPVIRLSDRRVIGLHHAGNSRTGFNQAIPMRLILENSSVLVAAAPSGSVPLPVPPTAPGNPQVAACQALWGEAKELGCLGYEAYVEECGTHVFASLAKRYVAQNCAVAEAPKPVPNPVVNPKPDNGGGVVLTVKANGGGDYRDLQSAVAAAPANGRIDVYPGTYTGGISVNKPLNIVGVGDRSRIVLQASDTHVIYWTADSGRIANLTIRQQGSTNTAVLFWGGSATLEDSDLTSTGLSVVEGTDGAAPTIRNNVIHDGQQTGVFLYNNSGGRVEGNDIYGNRLAGLELRSGANSVVRFNTFRNNKESGAFVYSEGLGVFEENEFYDNGLSGLEISELSNPVVRNNEFRNNGSNGVFVQKNALGTIENNRMIENAFAGLEIKAGGNPEVRNNIISNNKQGGVFFNTDAQGLLVDNTISNNTYSGVELKDGANPTLRRNTIKDNREGGVFAHANGRGLLEDNVISGNAYAGFEIKGGANPTVRGNRITGNVYQAAWIHEGGRGRFENNDMRGNGQAAFLIDSDAGRVVRRGNKE